MLKIKLQRIGKKGQPQYRIVVAEAKSKLSGTIVEQIGYYNPLKKPVDLRLDQQKYASWLKQGAQPTPTVRNLAIQTSK